MSLLSRKRAQLIPYQILLAREDIPFCAAEDLHLFLSITFDRLLAALRTRTLAGLGIPLPTIVEDVMACAIPSSAIPCARWRLTPWQGTFALPVPNPMMPR